MYIGKKPAVVKFAAFFVAFEVAGAGFSSAAAASTDTTTFNVSITISATCDIHTGAAANVAFGTVYSTAVNVDQAGSLTANCTPGTTYAISLDSGQNASGSQRRMVQGSNYVAYNLYRDSARSLSWGSTSGTDTYAGTGTGSGQTIPVYGRVPSANSPAGTYSDTVTATITY